MKKYRLKVDSPWGKKGRIVTVKDVEGGQVLTADVRGWWVDVELYPDIFEEVIQQSDEAWLAEWCHEHWLIRWPGYPYVEYKNKNIEFKNQWERLAKALIQHGFDVKKLRGDS